LSEIANRRLSAIREYTEFGSGFKIVHIYETLFLTRNRLFALFLLHGFTEKLQVHIVAYRLHMAMLPIREYTEFGSGFKIAMRDLEIRGAGNVLGAQQHGHMEAVGYDMYLQLILR